MTAAVAPLPEGAPSWSDTVIEISRIAMSEDSAAATAFADRLLAEGMPIEAIYLDVLAPAARRLGALWTDDGCDIADVTMGVWRLRDVLRNLSPSFQAEASVDHGRPILLVPAPGETHSFGLAMVSDFFGRAGWNVSGGPLTAGRDLSAWVGETWFAVVGFSVGCDASLDALAAGIRLVRRYSRNRRVRVMVGGPVFALHPETAARVGADATATDGRQAVAQANSLVSLPGGKHE
jgi:methanogenic corrinoid protein MtbC1